MNRSAAFDGSSSSDGNRKKNYKLVLDPLLKPGVSEKVYRFDGVLPGEPSVAPKDPRSRMLRFWTKREPCNLHIPKFTFDQYWVGTILPKEVTFTNLNDNINQNFLRDMCKGFGTIEECKIYYHLKTKKHLGIGKVLFVSTRSARACMEKLNQTSKMGNIMTLLLDTHGKERGKLLEEANAGHRPHPSPSSKARRKSDPRKKSDPPPIPRDIQTPASSGYGSLPGGHSAGQSDAGFSAPSEHSFISNTPHTPLSANTPQTPLQPNTPLTPAMPPHAGFQDQFGMQFPLQHVQPPPMAMGPVPPNIRPLEPPLPNLMPRKGMDIHMKGMPPLPGSAKPMMPGHMPPAVDPHPRLPPFGAERLHEASPHGSFDSAQDPPAHNNHRSRESNSLRYKRDNGRGPADGGPWQKRDKYSRRNQQWEAKDKYSDRYDGDRERDSRYRDQDYGFEDSDQPLRGGRGLHGDREGRSRSHGERDYGYREDWGDKYQTEHRERFHGDKYGEGGDGNWEGEYREKGRYHDDYEDDRFGDDSAERQKGKDGHRKSRKHHRHRHRRGEERYSRDYEHDGERHRHRKHRDYEASDSGRDEAISKDKGKGKDLGLREGFLTPPVVEPAPLPEPRVIEQKPPEPEPEPEAPRMLSLESRIQSLLRQSKDSDLGASTEDSSTSQLDAPMPDEDSQPPMPMEPAPPLPEMDAPPPPLPPSEAPPLPPEPEDEGQPMPPGEETYMYLPYEMSGYMMEQNTVSVEVCTTGGKGGVEDDRMSLSSISSGEEKLEVNAPIHHQAGSAAPAAPAPQTPGMMAFWQNQTLQNNFLNNMANNYGQPPPLGGKLEGLPGLTVTAEDEVREKDFMNVLEQVISELKFIMVKDLRKKMVESSAFKSYENWWDQEGDKHKRPVPVGAAAAAAASNMVPSKPVQPTTSAPAAKVMDTSSSLASLFESKEGLGGGFGMGGLLGIRGAVPKMPSFRRKFNPPTPPPEEEEELEDHDDESFKGPRTPEESGNEEEQASDDEEDRQARSKRKRIESDESDSESEKSEEESEGEEASSGASSGSESEGSEYGVGSGEESSEEEESSSEEEEEEEEEEEATSDKEQSAADNSDVEVEAKKKVPEEEEAEKEETKQDESDVDVGENEAKAVSPIKEEEEEVQVKAEKEDQESMEVDIETVTDKKDPVKRVSRALEKLKQVVDSIDQSGIKTEEPEVKAEVDHDLEEAAALALLSMHDYTGQKKAASPKKKPAPAAPASPRYTSSGEHSYSMKEPGVIKPPQPLDNGDTDLTDSASEGEPDLIPCLPPSLQQDHSYCQLFHPVETTKNKQTVPAVLPVPIEGTTDTIAADIGIELEVSEAKPARTPAKGRGRGKKQQLADVTNLQKGSRELASLLPPVEPFKPKPKPTFKQRNLQEELQVTYDFLLKGIDAEDTQFLKRRYEELLQDDSPHTYWLNNTHWMEHPQTLIPDPAPPRKRRKYSQDLDLPQHKSGSARTEGYYKISNTEKKVYLTHARGADDRNESEGLAAAELGAKTKKVVQLSREARHESRRLHTLLSALGEEIGGGGELFKLDPLKFRKKQLKFARSHIHDWGLFALEPIAAEEMVIEYVGQSIRQSMADLREKKYESIGIGSSYLFRVDTETIIDATKCGNLARFINHCCNPNCYAKIISVENQKKIVIYSKRDIDVNEEITYDYKFPIEDEKIPCLCGGSSCRGTLN